MEKDLEKMNDLWNSLKSAIADRERKLDQGLLQSGKFADAMGGLLSWFDEMDDMIANQKPPSSDYKVIKAQMQEQKFVQKLLNDRVSAIDNLVKMGKDVAANADPSERRRIEGEIETIKTRCVFCLPFFNISNFQLMCFDTGKIERVKRLPVHSQCDFRRHPKCARFFSSKHSIDKNIHLNLLFFVFF